MPAPGELKRKKKTKNPFRWIKEKILDPVMKKLKPHIQNFLKTKFGSSMKKFAHWINQSVIQQDKFGLMNAIKSVVPGGQYLDQALKIAGNLAEKADYDAIGKFVEKLVYNSDKQDQVIRNYSENYNESITARSLQDAQRGVERIKQEEIKPAVQQNMEALRIRIPNKVTNGIEGAKIQPMRRQASGQMSQVEADEDDEDSTMTKNQLAAKKIFGKPIN